MNEQDNSNKLFLGTFNSEHFWRDRRLSKLPSIKDPQNDAIVTVMDELQFVFCENPNDLLLTRYPLDPVFKEYLNQLGFNFISNQKSIYDDNIKSDHDFESNICMLLLNTPLKDYFCTILNDNYLMSPYSILTESSEFCSYYKIKNSFPDIQIVKKVNSKIYSHHLSKRLFEGSKGKLLNSSSELFYSGKELLKKSHFIIKDQYGVSGNGNIVIDSENKLLSIYKYIDGQERKGKKTEFLLEPLLDKKIDFSCQFEIDKSGKVNIISIQQMKNNGFSFFSIQTADSLFIEQLEQIGYFYQVNEIAMELFNEGYFGYVCLDSMQLQDNTIIPIVEINARKSMGLINYQLNRFLSNYNVSGYLTFFHFKINRKIDFKEVINHLDKNGILFKENRTWGILPLSSKTLVINQNGNNSVYKARLYCSIILKNPDERISLLRKLYHTFTELNMYLINKIGDYTK